MELHWKIISWWKFINVGIIQIKNLYLHGVAMFSNSKWWGQNTLNSFWNFGWLEGTERKQVSEFCPCSRSTLACSQSLSVPKLIASHLSSESSLWQCEQCFGTLSSATSCPFFSGAAHPWPSPLYPQLPVLKILSLHPHCHSEVHPHQSSFWNHGNLPSLLASSLIFLVSKPSSTLWSGWPF